MRKHEKIYPVVDAMGMWESRRDFQRVWEGWEAGIMAFHALHTMSFHGLLLAQMMPNYSYITSAMCRTRAPKRSS
jgi:hypothetical protein